MDEPNGVSLGQTQLPSQRLCLKSAESGAETELEAGLENGDLPLAHAVLRRRCSEPQPAPPPLCLWMGPINILPAY